jgi:hypothetical protein
MLSSAEYASSERRISTFGPLPFSGPTQAAEAFDAAGNLVRPEDRAPVTQSVNIPLQAPEQREARIMGQ